MKAGEKIFVRSYDAYTTEDEFSQGVVGNTHLVWTSKDNPIKGRFDTIEDALKAVCKANCFEYVPDNWLNFGKECSGEIGRFDFSVMVNVDNTEASPWEIEAWKRGCERLWACQLSVYLGICAERDLTFEEIAV